MIAPRRGNTRKPYQSAMQLGPLGLLCLALCVVAAGCASTRAYDDPAAVALDREADLAWRRRALTQIAQQPLSPVDFAALHELVWSDRQPFELRTRAMDLLLRHDADHFWVIADRRLASVSHRGMLEHICAAAADARRTDAIPALIKSWVRPAPDTPDDQRPEAIALARLVGPDAVQSTLQEVLFDPDARHDLTHEAAAWAVLNRLLGPAAAAELLAAHDPVHDTGLARDLAAAARVLGELPVAKEQVMWLSRVRRLEAEIWQRWSQAAATLSPVQRAGLALRHLPAVQHAPPALLDAPPAELRRLALREAGALTSHPRGRDVEDQPYVKARPEGFAEHADRLVWGDDLVYLLLRDALDEPDVTAALFAMADADLADTGAEHGGALLWDNGTLIARRFATSHGNHDHRFVSSQALVLAAQSGLAHFHFHAQRHDNAAYAGPGAGDLAFADRMGFNCLVFTFIDADTLAVDYYRPGHVILDMGVIRR